MSEQTTPYEDLLPHLSEEEFEALKADIAQRGVQVPVEYDEHGNILDGHHRVRACHELGIKDWPRIVRVGLSEEEKIEHALALNLVRRHLTREQRQELVSQATPAWTELAARSPKCWVWMTKTVYRDHSGLAIAKPEHPAESIRRSTARPILHASAPKPSARSWSERAQSDAKREVRILPRDCHQSWCECWYCL
ncbi:MAG: hypothetical protein KatS3mg038_2325 [Candidatus Kapaibacterium sp.]|nr:MAG: hypothetical protein KatS3mg038_2325 [Candidatus Kapabacteria bacterium]